MFKKAGLLITLIFAFYGCIKDNEVNTVKSVYYYPSSDSINLYESENINSKISRTAKEGEKFTFVKTGKRDKIGGVNGNWALLKDGRDIQAWGFKPDFKSVSTVNYIYKDTDKNSLIYAVFNTGKNFTAYKVIAGSPDGKNNKIIYEASFAETGMSSFKTASKKDGILKFSFFASGFHFHDYFKVNGEPSASSYANIKENNPYVSELFSYDGKYRAMFLKFEGEPVKDFIDYNEIVIEDIAANKIIYKYSHEYDFHSHISIDKWSDDGRYLYLTNIIDPSMDSDTEMLCIDLEKKLTVKYNLFGVMDAFGTVINKIHFFPEIKAGIAENYMANADPDSGAQLWGKPIETYIIMLDLDIGGNLNKKNLNNYPVKSELLLNDKVNDSYSDFVILENELYFKETKVNEQNIKSIVYKKINLDTKEQTVILNTDIKVAAYSKNGFIAGFKEGKMMIWNIKENKVNEIKLSESIYSIIAFIE